MNKKNNEFEAGQPEVGDFPFPLPNGTKESPYLNWLRNHSNYMVTRGFLDYLRIAAIMMRGILLNLLIITPFLLILSVVIGHFYGPQLRSAAIIWSDIPLEKIDDLAFKLTGPVSDNVKPSKREGSKRPIDTWISLSLDKQTRDDLTNFKILLIDYANNIENRTEIGLIGPSAKQFRKNRLKKARNDIHVVLVEYLSNVIGNKVIYNATLFKDIYLSPTTEQLLFTSRGHTTIPSGSDLRRLNRLLLEDAYPAEIKKHRALDVGFIYGWFERQGFKLWMPQPFKLTVWTVWLAVLMVLLAPVGRVFRAIKGHRQSIVRAGSDSSVEARDRSERWFGLALLLILLAATFETLPVLVDQFHHFRVSPDMNWDAIFASMAGVSIAVMGAASKLLSVLSGLKKKIGMLLIGTLGILAPLLVLLYVTEFLVYTPSIDSDGWLPIVIFVIPAIFIALVLAGIVYGHLKKSFTKREVLWLFLLVGILGMLTGIGFYILYGFGYLEGHPESLVNALVIVVAIEIWIYCRIVVDINWTSIHGLYRDRLASAYLVGHDTRGDVAIEEDINLWEIGSHEHGSVAPYHLINTTLNLQGSKDISLRDRSSDFFVFSKRFVGGERTGYCRSATLEQVHPEMNLATAMAISAAAASPNMGRGTSPAMVAMMVLLNIRLGYWLPNPGLLEEKFHTGGLVATLARVGQSIANKFRREVPDQADETPGFTFKQVFDHELGEVERRWSNVYANDAEHEQRNLFHVDDQKVKTPTTAHGLVGVGFSGGGIRSATINLGIAQALHARGVFDHIDYMSTVSGGGYLGSSISTLMRRKSDSADVPRAAPGFHTLPRKHRSEIEGVAKVSENYRAEKVVIVEGQEDPRSQKEYRFLKFDKLVVKTGDKVNKGQELIARHNALLDRFSWRVRPMALLNEMMMRLDETHKWVNLSDGGHIENLAGIELLRRRCRFIIIGDGEADPNLSFNGLATLIRYARIDLGIKIEIKTDAISPDRSKMALDEGRDRLSPEHWVLGTINYPPLKDDESGPEFGYLLYLKSSFSGDEDEVIKEYRYRNPSFPHQSTADQFFNEEQFECYRALGEHIGNQPFKKIEGRITSDKMSYEEFRTWVMELNSSQKSE